MVQFCHINSPWAVPFPVGGWCEQGGWQTFTLRLFYSNRPNFRARLWYVCLWSNDSQSLNHFLTTGLCCIYKSKNSFHSTKQGGWVRPLLELFLCKIVTMLRESFIWSIPDAYAFQIIAENQPLISRLTPVLCSWLLTSCVFIVLFCIRIQNQWPNVCM